MAQNPFVWIEIPVSDMDRAQKFYEDVFQFEIKRVDFGGFLMGWFPSGDMNSPGATGTLVQQESYIPSQEGTMVYFHSANIIDELDRVEAAGGKIYQPKTKISDEHGFMGVFIDSEGNRVALHATN